MYVNSIVEKYNECFWFVLLACKWDMVSSCASLRIVPGLQSWNSLTNPAAHSSHFFDFFDYKRRVNLLGSQLVVHFGCKEMETFRKFRPQRSAP